jgi:hypothetical protein
MRWLADHRRPAPRPTGFLVPLLAHPA